MKEGLAFVLALTTAYMLSSSLVTSQASQVCGPDGNTYPNHCVLEETACVFNEGTLIYSEGPCDPKCAQVCPVNYDPQCGTDGKTYPNPCLLKVSLCKTNGVVRLDYHGACLLPNEK
ncbi:four-domain proteases inhibitor-like [Dendronephthya gigantea]|uniref:four-domain proteases inhibitor-like n=1 Tax=Dendronephthya gigantea TaxID=151771 RepID=UPI00106C4042|nr:four-domain proteases inhibitor-like [Dendronephthya gigantea]